MLHINIFCIGKIKEKFFKDAIIEYSKRLSKYCLLNFIELPDKSIPSKANSAIEKQIIDIESNSILSKLNKNSYNIVLDSHGQQFSSEDFALFINSVQQESSELNFIIGGSLGLNDEIKNFCDKKISLSQMTFPHQLIRVFILEQLFRAYKINNNEKYHH